MAASPPVGVSRQEPLASSETPRRRPEVAAKSAPEASVNARLLGRKPVLGPLSDSALSSLVSDLRKATKTPSDLRCSLSVSQNSLLVTFYTKRDEGFFESDGESSNAASPPPSATAPAISEPNKSDSETKIIKDHVFSASSDDSCCGGDSSDEKNSSKSPSPTSELHKRFDHSESFPLGDILFCHTDRELRTCLVWVVRKGVGSSEPEALVFDCASEEAARDVSRKFLELSKRSKLEQRHRRRKSDGGGGVSRSVEAIFRSEKAKSVVEVHKSMAGFSGKQGAAALSVFQPPPAKAVVQSTSKSPGQKKKSPGLEIVNYESPPKAGGGGPGRYSLVQHTDKNGVTHIEVENSKKEATVSKTAVNVDEAGSKVVADVKSKSKFARELENILSKELETRQGGDAPDKSKGAVPRNAMGESLSLRQRAPALLLKKLDEFEEKAARVWAKAEAEESQRREREQEEERSRRLWGHGRHPSKMASRTPPPPSKRHHLQLEREGGAAAFWKAKFKAGGEAGGSGSPASGSPSLGFKLRAPSPPPPLNMSSSSAQSSPAVAPKKEAASKQNSNAGSEKQILVPTKTGKEPVKKLYPKEPNPELQQMRTAQLAAAQQAVQAQARFIQLPAGAAAVPFAGAAQPHSLPIIPLPIAWARYPTEFTPAEQQQLLAAAAAQQQQVAAAQAQWAVARQQQQQQLMVPMAPTGGGSVAARGRSRDRARIDVEQRRRAQSKSPARRPASTCGYDAEGSLLLMDRGSASDPQQQAKAKGNLSRKFREFSDAVRLKMSRNKNAPPAPMTGLGDMPDAGARHNMHLVPQQLKSNLKKQSSSGAGGSDAASALGGTHMTSEDSSGSGSEDKSKKVHFNKFATVQMME